MKVLLALILLTTGSLSFAQTQATLFGQVVHNTSGIGLPFVSVDLNAESQTNETSGVLTDAEGYFEIEGVPTGNYTLRFSLSGYSPQQASVLVFESNSNYDLGQITLSSTSSPIQEISVLGQQTNVGPTLESRIYNIENNLAQSNGSLADVMRTLPGVTVEQDGRIQLRGSDRVVILIDGKQSSLTGFGNQAGLDNIPAGGIATIEIINNPSSQYDSSGMAGVINITYKDTDNYGLAGDVGLSYGIGQFSRRKPDLPTELGSFTHNPKIIPTANLSFRTDKFRYFLNAQYMEQDDLPNNEFTTRYYEDGRITFSQVPENRRQSQGILSAGMDWNIDDNNLFTLSTLLDYESHQDNAQVPYINGSDMQNYRYWFWREEEDTGYINLNAELEHSFREPGHTLSGSIQYTVGSEDEDYFLNDRSALRNSFDVTHLKAIEHTLPLQVDYVRPLSSGRVELGAKLQKRWIPVTYDVERGVDSIIYEGLGNRSEWGETVYSGYANLVYENLHWGVEGGARMEQTDVYYDLAPENTFYPGNDNYDYFKVYPNLRVAYKFNDDQSLALYYTSRVDRPGEPELRIFPKYDDPELLKVGNPYLRPQFTTNLELSFEQLWLTGSAIASIYQRDIEDPFIRVLDIDESDTEYSIINRIYTNVGSARNRGLELILTQDIGDYWKLSGSINWYRNTVDPYTTQLLFPVPRPFSINGSEDDTWNLSVNNQLDLPWNIRMQLSYTYYAARNFAQGQEAARSSLDLGLSKPVFKDKADLVVSISDMFNNFGIRQDIDGNGFRAVYENYFESQVLSVGLRYTL